METVLQDVRFALRSFRKRLLFSTIAIATLAIGIGGNATFFTIVRAALLRPLPFHEPDRLVELSLRTGVKSGDPREMVWSYPKYQVLLREQRAFATIAGYMSQSFTITGAGEAERIDGELIDGPYLETLGLPMIAGRSFTPAEQRDPGLAAVAMISESLWRRRFNADPAILGRTLITDGKPVTIVGIAASDFRGLTGRAEIWTPMVTMGVESLTEQHSHFFSVVARLTSTASIESAQSEARRLGAVIDREIPPPGGQEPWSAASTPLEQLRIDPAIRGAVLILFAAIGMVLLIACANVANLMLARALDRRREIAVRLAIGAGHGRLVRQLITESLVLALLGGIAGVLLTIMSINALNAGVAFDKSPVIRQLSGLSTVSLSGIAIDLPVLMFATAATVFTGLLFGLAPALQAARASLTSDLKNGVTTLGRIRGLNSRSVLVITQIAIAFVLLSGAGLMLRSLDRLLATDAGMEPANLLTARISLPESYTPDQVHLFWQHLLERSRGLGGVQHAALVDCPPLAGGCNSTVVWFPESAGTDNNTEVGVHFASSDYPRAVQLTLLKGRMFTPADRVGAPKVVVINQSAANRLFGNGDPIGRRIAVGQGGFGDGAEIIGVVADQRFETLEAPPKPDVYINFQQAMRRRGMLLLRSASDPLALVTPLRRELQQIDPNLPLYDVLSMEQRVDNSLARTRITGFLLSMFAAIALLLATVGIYGVVAYAVVQRTREIGVRMALGALRRDILGNVLRFSGTLVLSGTVIGVLAAIATTRFLRSFLYEVDPIDPTIFAVLVALLVTTAIIASLIPALRAARVDPIIALKSE